MYVEDFEKNLLKRRRHDGLEFQLESGATQSEFDHAQALLAVTLPEPVRTFYSHYNGLEVRDPAIVILPLGGLVTVARHHLHFSTVDGQHRLCFDTSKINDAGQWDIVTLGSNYQVTRTMESFWSNRIWAWIDLRREIWRTHR